MNEIRFYAAIRAVAQQRSLTWIRKYPSPVEHARSPWVRYRNADCRAPRSLHTNLRGELRKPNRPAHTHCVAPESIGPALDGALASELFSDAPGTALAQTYQERAAEMEAHAEVWRTLLLEGSPRDPGLSR